MKKLSIGLVVLALAGCATGGGSSSRPAWIDDASAQYSDSQYMTGTGSASNLNDAKERARADLVKIFEVRIKAIVQDIQESKSVETAQGRVETVTNDSSVNIVSETDHLIQGLQIAEVWQDPSDKNFYALALLERSQAINNLKDEMQRLDGSTEEYLKNSKQNDNKLYQVGQYIKAIEAQQGRDVFNRYLKVLNKSGSGSASKWQSEKLTEELNSLLTTIKVAVKVADGESKVLSEMVTGGISQAGFKAVPQAEADYLLQAGFELDQFKDDSDWHWARGAFKVSLDDLKTNKSQGTKRWSVKASASSPDMAKTRLYDKVEKILKNELGSAILKMAE